MLQAGAGFGKTTILSQALERREDDPMCVDRWLGCGARDDSEGEFAAGLRLAMGLSRSDGDTVRVVCDAVWKESPAEVAIVIDDVHHISPGSASAQLLERLLQELPANGHLVLAGRKEAPVSASRLLAAGQAQVIAETELAFDGNERSTFRSLRGTSDPARDSSGWPAILELAASAGKDRVGAYLWEEVLAALPEERRRGLARMACLEWIDDGRIEAFTGSAEDVASFVEDLPLTSFEPSGAARLHGLWVQVLASVEPRWSQPQFHTARDFLVDGHHYREAIELCLHNDRNDDISEVLARLISRIWHDGDRVTLETILAMLPEEIRNSPAGKCIEGFKRMREDPANAQPYLRAARAGFAEDGNVLGQSVAIATLAMIAFFRTDGAMCVELAGLAAEIGNANGMAMHHQLLATGLLLESQPSAALPHLDRARQVMADLGGADAVTASTSYIELGYPERAIVAIEQALPTAYQIFHAALLAAHFDASWLSGRQTPDELASFDAGLPKEAMGHAHNSAVFLSLLAFYNAAAGRPAVAKLHLDGAAPLLARGLGARAESAFAVAKMAIEIADDDEASARNTIEHSLEVTDPALLSNRHLLRGMALASLVSPVARDRFGTLSPGPCYALGLRAAEALRVHRESGDATAARELPWESHKQFSIFLVPPALLELAVVAASVGNEHAGALAESLASDHHDVLRRFQEKGSGVALFAEELLRRVPARPSGRLELRVLGTLELTRDGVVVDDPVLRRERVRALLQYLAAHGRCDREAVAAAVWQDLDERERANNLRVSLNYLRKLLEPDRASGAPSFFLPPLADHIELRTGDGLELDAARFEQALAKADAADAAGDPRVALIHYEEGLVLYRGDYLSDAAETDWGEADRTRLRASFVRATLRVAELRHGNGEHDGVLASAARALEVDPLSERAYRMQALAYLRKDDRSAARSAMATGLRTLDAAKLVPRSNTLRLAIRLGIDVSAWEGRERADASPGEATKRVPVGGAEDAGLSPRELEVVRLVDAGLSNGEIASRLYVAPSTIKKHLENIYDKLGVRRRTQAVQLVREQGLLD